MIDLVVVGRAALGLAFGVAFLQLGISGLAIWQRKVALTHAARNSSIVLAAIMTIAVASLTAGFLSRDFSIAFVADTSSRSMPVGLTISALWGGQEGSLLFWAWVLSLFSSIATYRMSSRDDVLAPWGIGTLALIGLFFLGVLVFVSSPFQRLVAAPPDGSGLNPLLWDSGMQVHPPMLLTGYMSFTIPFAFATSILAAGRVSQLWLREMRNWMLIAWAIQSAGLLLGAWWAYRVLGWGGYWGWDPVENVALLPWLVATAYIHSALAQERRGQLRAWSIGLVLTGFALAIFGTFVVRSGILTSVHSFALSNVGPIFLIFVGVVLVAAVLMFIYRLPLLRTPLAIDSFASKEAGFLLNNFLLLAVAVAVFWGTVFPIISELIQGSRIAVGPPFYSQVTVPLLLTLLALLGIGPLLAWRRTTLHAAWRSTRWPVTLALVTSAVLIALGMRVGLAVLGFSLAAMVITGALLEFSRSLRTHARMANGIRAARIGVIGNRRRLGSHIVHLGVAIFAVGVIGSSSFSEETSVTLARGKSAVIDEYRVTYRGLSTRSEPGLTTIQADIDVDRGRNSSSRLTPSRRIHTGWENQPTSDVAIHTTFPALDDIYILIDDWEPDGSSASFRILVNPLVPLLWVGGMLYFIGVMVVAYPWNGTRRLPGLTLPVPPSAIR